MAKKRTFYPYDPPIHWIADTDTKTSHRYPDVYHLLQPGKLLDHQMVDEQTIELTTGTEVKIRIRIWTDTIWQVRYAKEEFTAQPSYALVPDLQPGNLTFSVEKKGKHLLLESENVQCRIELKNCRISFRDKATGKTILTEAESYLERASINEGANHLRISFEQSKEEAYYGLGGTWTSVANIFRTGTATRLAITEKKTPFTAPFLFTTESKGKWLTVSSCITAGGHISISVRLRMRP